MPLGLFHKTKRLKLNKQIQFLDQICKLVNHNYTFKHSLEMMTYDPQFSNLAKTLINFLHEGHSIEESFRKLNFESLVIAYMYFSKEAGNLSEHLNNCRQLLTMKYNMLKKIKDIIRYPAFLLTMSIALFIFMSIYLLPVYSNSLQQLGNQQSLLLFQSIYNIFNISVILLCLCTLIGCLLYFFTFKKIAIQTKISIISKIPVLSKFYRLIISMQLAYFISSILQSGKTIREALSIIYEQQDLKIIQHYSQIMTKKLSNGEKLSRAFEELEFVEEEMKYLIEHSDREGTLQQDLSAYSSLIIDTIDQKIKQIIFFIQPILYLIIGVFIILIYIFAFYPMFSIIEQL